MVTVIFFMVGLPVCSIDEFTEHVNSVPFKVLFTDCSVRVFADTWTDDRSVLVFHSIIALLSSRSGTVQLIV